MDNTPRILVFAGSARKESLNRKLAAAAHQMIQDAGGVSTLLDAAEVSLPLYNQDLEENGLPEEALRLKKIFAEHDALLIASPEYNSSITPFLKNLIDWVSRPTEGEEMTAQFRGKVAGLVSASPSGLGGMRALVHVRDILGNIGVLVIPEQKAIPNAFDVFDEEGKIQDENVVKGVRTVVESLVASTQKLKG
ncbi:NADPH-dependent FMN reductase [Puniceicoccus vermicola]|uniref:NAD(P)H-dependent oxidoreductase n=1 Tax=Puniceicoccus vermicola TaxID=388746 RepID=A0A7X1AX79_9BACT|nr:NADPH-dependent FMN reductase [Puniceicoccus vermicola]MBC2600673.1 NAD(P)H-dependent oxidoreductase [Puniceicoccus vermicola]